MHRIDVPSATPDNQFTEGSPSGGVPATTVAADWLNDLQENVCEVIEAAGIALSKGDSLQLLQAITANFLSNLGLGGASASDYIEIPYRDKTDGTLKYLVVQWGAATVNAGTPVTVTLPQTLPNALLVNISGVNGSGSSSASQTLSTSQIRLTVSTGTGVGVYWLVIGW